MANIYLLMVKMKIIISPLRGWAMGFAMFFYNHFSPSGLLPDK
jgi:hypothetical protein